MCTTQRYIHCGKANAENERHDQLLTTASARSFIAYCVERATHIAPDAPSDGNIAELVTVPSRASLGSLKSNVYACEVSELASPPAMKKDRNCKQTVIR